jgi:hypothetical protein
VTAHLDEDNGADRFRAVVTGDPCGLSDLTVYVDGGQDEDSGMFSQVVDAVNVETADMI